MRRVRFRDSSGTVRGGRWTTEEGKDVVTAAAGPYGRIAFGDETFDPDEIDVLPPCEPTKILCVGHNYAEQVAERGGDVPDRPLLFFKTPNTVAAHGSTVTVPRGKEQIDFEGELGVVIGEQCRYVDAADAEDVIAGYTCLNDLTNRDDQAWESNLVRSKAFDGAAPIGPVVATDEHLPPDAAIETRVNGETRQSATIDDMIFSIPELIEEVTDYMTLEPGDVIATGTPKGGGRLEDGDVVEVEIEGIGTLRHAVEYPDR